MPYVSITTAKKVDAPARDKLSEQIGGAISVIPGKNRDNTLLCIVDGKPMYKSGAPNNGVFVEVRLYGRSPEDAKKEFAGKLRAILKDVLALEEADCLYMHYIESETWG